jgi:hypothetical protein
MTDGCPMCGEPLPTPSRGRVPLYCSTRCRTRAWRARSADTTIDPGRALAETDGIPALQLADTLKAAAGRTAMSLNTGLPADPGDLDRLAVISAALIARVRAAHPGEDWTQTAPASSVHVADLSSRDDQRQAAPPQALPAPAEVPESSRDDSAARPAVTRSSSLKRMPRKKAEQIVNTATVVKDPGHRENHQWNVVAADGTVIGHVEPSYGGASRSGRNGWCGWAHGMTRNGDRHPTKDAAAVAAAMSWLRITTAPPRR